MEQFSSRRQTITVLTERLACEFEAQHGYAPDARALGKLRLWANHASRAAWNVQASRQRDAILQPPKPDVVPASKVLERSHDRQADLEPELE
jgi:hypothetical protein